MAFFGKILAFLRIYKCCNSVPTCTSWEQSSQRLWKKKCKKKDSKGWFLLGRPFILFWHLVHLLQKTENYKKQLRKVSPIFSHQNAICTCCFKCAVVLLQFANLPISISRFFFQFNFFYSMHVFGYLFYYCFTSLFNYIIHLILN